MYDPGRMGDGGVDIGGGRSVGKKGASRLSEGSQVFTCFIINRSMEC